MFHSGCTLHIQIEFFFFSQFLVPVFSLLIFINIDIFTKRTKNDYESQKQWFSILDRATLN